MGNSLRDELLKVGLVSDERLEKPRRPRRGKKRPANKRDRAPAQAAEDRSAAAARHVLRENQRRTARFVRDPSLGGGSVAESAKKALRRKIQELLQGERRNHDQAEIPYHFIKGKRIKRVYVTEAQRGELTDGKLVIAALEGNHHLLTPDAARQLLALASQTVICSGAEADPDPDTVDADGDDHPVPDDITW
jgi:uncharacterized protein YaiL (DUF2058 family)